GRRPGSNGRRNRRRPRIISCAPRPSPPALTNMMPRPALRSRRTAPFMAEAAIPAPRPEPQFATMPQQAEAATLGIWVFLATEVLFFSGMLLAYAVLRKAYPAGFAEASRETKIVIGTINTAVLLTSSATMAWGVHAAEAGHRRLLTWLLAATAALGLVFLVLKGVEYSQEYDVPGLNFSPVSPHARAMELFYF